VLKLPILTGGTMIGARNQRGDKESLSHMVASKWGKKIMRNVVVVPLLWNLEQNVWCGGGEGGWLSMLVMGAGPSSLVNLMAKSVPIQSTPGVGTTEYLLACLQDVSVVWMCVCSEILSFGSQQLTRLVPRRLDGASYRSIQPKTS
jgi:hypothetical protein